MAKISLEQISVASPCPASWDAMSGDERTRFCGQCGQFVYNISRLTQDEAEALIAEHEGKMCVRYFRRIDGTIMTADCPMGWSGVKRRVAIAGSVVAAAIVGLLGFLSLGVLGARQDDPWRRNPLAIIQDMIFPRAIAGDICPAPPPRPVGINPLAPQDPGDVNDN